MTGEYPQPILYHDLAAWWPLLSAPEDYEGEAEYIRTVLEDVVSGSLNTMLELGSGGGNNASFLKRYFELTLVDISIEMLAVSKELNPESEHLHGDMRTVRLNKIFDVVLLHDAIMYMTTEDNLRQALQTAWSHCRRGGAVIILPDYVKETFQPSTRHGGHDGFDRALRYLEWTYDPDERDSSFITEFAYLLRTPDGNVSIYHDRHYMGLFSRQTWLKCLQNIGFQVEMRADPYQREIFLGMR